MKQRVKALYPFDGDVKDFSGQGNDGTDNTSAGFVSGPLGTQAKDFDGTDDYVSVSDTTELSGRNKFTLSAWVNADNLPSNDGQQYDIITKWDASNAGREFRFRAESSGDTFQISIHDESDNSSASTSSSTTVSTTDWQHVVATYRGTTLKVYVNGSEEGSTTASLTIQDKSTDVYIGSEETGTGREFNGAISNAIILDRAWTPQEVAYLYEKGQHARFVSETKTL